ncbi:MAG TPA: GNAT family N-acetyltransferase [Nitriliruptorales bacterium]
MVVVRDGTAADLPAVAAIYTHYVLKTTVTFNIHVRTPREWQERHQVRVVDGPYHLLVAERDNGVVGFTETSQFRPKPAYDRTCEVTIYTAPDTSGAGVGTALYDALFQRLTGGRFHRAIALVALPNDASVRFHQRHGFVHRGTLTEVGHKFGRWLDVAFYERALDEPDQRRP